MFTKFCKLPTNNLETISFVPRDSILHTIDLSIVLRTNKCLRVFLDSVDSPPSVREGKCNDIATNPCKAIDQYSSLCRSRLRDVLCNAPRLIVNIFVILPYRPYLRCNRLRCHAKPGFFRHPDTFIISGKYAMSLVVISASVNDFAFLCIYDSNFWMSQGTSFRSV